MIEFRLRTILVSLVMVIASGTVFFRFAEGWGWLDSYFFTVVTISTVGYGNLVPATAIGKIGATVLIFLGLGVFAAAIQYVTHFQIARRERHLPARGEAEALHEGHQRHRQLYGADPEVKPDGKP